MSFVIRVQSHQSRFLYSSSMPQRIFISIACLMDSDIINTIEDCLAKAVHGQHLVFGVCLQCDSEHGADLLGKFANHPQVRVKKLSWTEARGPTFARYHCAQMLQDETFFLQIDCHTRFFLGWDEILVNELVKCEKMHPKAVLSHYPLNITNMEDPQHQSHIGHIATFRYIGTDAIKTHGKLIKRPVEPLQSWGIMAAMVFARSRLLTDVPYDEKLYNGYHAEEQFFYSVRLWTQGYNCYTPTRHALAMEYITNAHRIPLEVRKHIANGGAQWTQRTWAKCKYYLLFDTLKNIKCNEYEKDVLLHQTALGLGTARYVVDYYKMTGLHDKLCELFPLYNAYQKIQWHKNTFCHHIEIHNPGASIAVVTQNTPNLVCEYADLTRTNHLLYCNQHNYTYYSFYQNLAEEVPKRHSPKVCWSKVKACLHTLNTHQYVMWMDADAIFVDLTTRIEDTIRIHPTKDFYLSKDPKSHFINSGVMIWKNSSVAQQMLNNWWNREHLSYRQGGDQVVLADVVQSTASCVDKWHHFEEHEFNCYPSNVSSGNYIVHFMGVKSKLKIRDKLTRWNRLLTHESAAVGTLPYIYISVATIPSRIDGIHLLVEEWLKSSIVPHKIVFHIPHTYRLFPDESNHIATLHTSMADYIRSGHVHINVLDTDYGPCNKYLGMVAFYNKQDMQNINCVTIVCDDDLLYHPFMIEELVNAHKRNPRAVITGYNNTTVHLRVDNAKIPLLKGGNLCLLPHYFYVSNICPSLKTVIDNATNDQLQDCVFADDNIITAFLHKKRIPIISIHPIIRKKGFATSYKYNPILRDRDIGVSNPKNKLFNRSHISVVCTHFSRYYDWDRYSNVPFLSEANKKSILGI